jgi:hypothetical protein
MSKSVAEPSREEAEKLANTATTTSFNWVVFFLSFVAGLVGLLQIVKPYESNTTQGWWVFTNILFVVYLLLTLGLSYSIYAIFHTRFLIIHLTNIDEYESQAVKDFKKKYWTRVYEPLIVCRNGNFRKWVAVTISVLSGIFSILLLLSLLLVNL